jgi:hypothetical protein
VLDAIARQDDWLSVTEIELLVHPQKPIGRRTIQVTLKDLHTQKLIERKGKKAKGYKYRLPLTPDRGGAQ